MTPEAREQAPAAAEPEERAPNPWVARAALVLGLGAAVATAGALRRPRERALRARLDGLLRRLDEADLTSLAPRVRCLRERLSACEVERDREGVSRIARAVDELHAELDAAEGEVYGDGRSTALRGLTASVERAVALAFEGA